MVADSLNSIQRLFGFFCFFSALMMLKFYGHWRRKLQWILRMAKSARSHCKIRCLIWDESGFDWWKPSFLSLPLAPLRVSPIFCFSVGYCEILSIVYGPFINWFPILSVCRILALWVACGVWWAHNVNTVMLLDYVSFESQLMGPQIKMIDVEYGQLSVALDCD